MNPSSSTGTALRVRVTLLADMRRFAPSDGDAAHAVTLGAGATAGDLLAALGVPADAEVTIGVDGELAARDTPLRDGAQVLLVSPMEGG
jgi:sulfur carrier protein ThiS